MTRAEVDALPWWEQRLLTEKMNEEFAAHDEDEGDDDDFSNEEKPAQTRTFDDAAAMGFTVHSV